MAVLGGNETTHDFFRELRHLLTNAFAGEFSNDDWDHGVGGTHIAVRASGVLVSHAAVVPRLLYIGDAVFSCGYVENVATLPDWRHRGLASIAMLEVNAIIASKYELGALSTSSKIFYRKFGWDDWHGPSYVIRDGEWTRSESEDSGIMILKVEPSSYIDSSARIGCEERSGDSW